MSVTRANPPDTDLPISTVSGCTPADRVKVGRKHLDQSRANEIRARLTEWKQLLESSRSSLRALARELGTSHQLLGHYLRHWEVWQAKEYQRQANELRRRARAETRPWVRDDMQPSQIDRSEAARQRREHWKNKSKGE